MLTAPAFNESDIIMALLRCMKNTHSMVVCFGEDTTIKIAYRLKSAFLQILQEPVEHYRFDLREIKETDITFVQLIIAFSNSLKRKEKRMSLLNCPGDSPFMKTCDLCGIDIRSIVDIEG